MRKHVMAQGSPILSHCHIPNCYVNQYTVLTSGKWQERSIQPQSHQHRKIFTQSSCLHNKGWGGTWMRQDEQTTDKKDSRKT